MRYITNLAQLLIDKQLLHLFWYYPHERFALRKYYCEMGRSVNCAVFSCLDTHAQAVPCRRLLASGLWRRSTLIDAKQCSLSWTKQQWDRFVFEFPNLLWHEYSNTAPYSYFTHLPLTFSHCATCRKVAGSIPDCVIGIFHWHNPSGRTMALGLTQPLTGMSTRNISWG
jgi:hypothetical protein